MALPVEMAASCTMEHSKMTDADQPRCLIVEDQILIGMSLEAFLEEHGFDVCGPLPSGTEALTWLEQETPEVAILDFSLNDGPATDLARELRQRDIPFIIYSGHPRGANLPPELAEVPWLEKPLARTELVSVLAQLVADRERCGRARLNS